MSVLSNLQERFGAQLSSYSYDIILALSVLGFGAAAAFLVKKVSFWLIKKLQSNDHRILRVVGPLQLHGIAVGVSRVLFWTTFFISFALTMQLFGVDIFQEWMKILANFIPNLFGAVLILISGFLSAKFLRDFLRRTSVAAGLEIANSLPTIAYVSTCAITVLVSIKQVGIDVEFLTSVILIVLFCTLLSGAISFGMGSAAIVTNILSTFYLKKGLRVGQWIEGKDFSGKVIAISPTAVHLQTSQGVDIVPSRSLNESKYMVKNVSDQ